MKLIDQHAKKIMEECKKRAEDAGLTINGETLEYIVTNMDLIELGPKVMIPTLYDYWVNDVEIVGNKWQYDAFPHNPYETVINTRPAISFYNDNNPDWLNVMIFYHVLGHIDFFHNNIFYRNTWDDDFCGQALADQRLINRIREEMGEKKRWVDYVIEFARGIDNLLGYYQELEEADSLQRQNIFGTFSEKSNFYFGEFMRNLHNEGMIMMKFYYDELDRYNQCIKEFGQERGEEIFFNDRGFRSKLPEFNSAFEKYIGKCKVKTKDVLQYLMEHSEFVNKEKNIWMKDVLNVIRKTSMYFQPQFRDHICNEGWASFWHERLFMSDPRIKGHEIDYAKINSRVLVMPRIGINPYALGKWLFEFIEELADKGKLSREFQLIRDFEQRKSFDQKFGQEYAKKILFGARRNLNDSSLINFLSDEDFQDFMDLHNLFVAGYRFSETKFGEYEIYIKSKSGKEYRKMVNKSLYHPPHIVISEQKGDEGELYLDHVFEGRTLVTKYIPTVLMGLSYLWGGKASLETTEFEMDESDIDLSDRLGNLDFEQEYKKVRVVYTCRGKNINRVILRKRTEQENNQEA
jgi:stage V sporulation protein R